MMFGLLRTIDFLASVFTKYCVLLEP